MHPLRHRSAAETVAETYGRQHGSSRRNPLFFQKRSGTLRAVLSHAPVTPETFAVVEVSPGEIWQSGRRVKPRDPVILHALETPRIRVVLDVHRGSEGDKIVMFDPNGLIADVCSRPAISHRLSAPS